MQKRIIYLVKWVSELLLLMMIMLLLLLLLLFNLLHVITFMSIISVS
jgi:hypothetical protein